MSDAIWRETLAGVRKRIDDGRDRLKAAEASVRAIKKSIKDDEGEHDRLYKAWILGVAEPPPVQAELFGGDAPAEEPTAAAGAVYTNLAEANAANWEAVAELAASAERSRAVREDLAIAEEPAPPPAKSWATAWTHTTAVVLPTGADYIHSTFTPAKFGRMHLEFKGPVSETGYRSYFFGRDGVPPTGWSGPVEFVDRLARHLCRVNAGKDAAEVEGAPAWRSRPIAELNIKPARANALRRGGIKVVGDLADAIALGCDVGRGEGVSEACWKEAAWALNAFIDGKVWAELETLAKPKRPAKKPRKPVGAAKLPTATVEPPDEASRVGCHAADQVTRRYWPVTRDGGGEVLGIVREFDRDSAWEAAERLWPHRRPLEIGEPSDQPPPLSESAEDAFKASLYPEGVDADWNRFRAQGLTNDMARAVLGTLWPATPTHHITDDGDSYTVVGLSEPGFWRGKYVPAFGMLREPDLSGPALFDAVRKVLRIPDYGDVGTGSRVVTSSPPKAAPRRKTKAKPAPLSQEAAL